MADFRNIIAGFVVLLCFSLNVSIAAEDPTAPLNWVAPKEAKTAVEADKVPKLQSIICQSRSTCFAILNNKVANVNDIISGYRVQAITSGGVIVVRGSTTRKLTLFVSDIKN